MARLLEIRITKARLFLTERELLNALPPELFKLGIQRGKAILRARGHERCLARKRAAACAETAETEKPGGSSGCSTGTV